jgi:polygalacturonase
VNKNNDGLDIDGCRNVRISDCDISSGDDAIVLKSTLPLPTENVAISNCVLSTACNAIKMGTESNGGFKNITVANCVVYDTRLSGVALEIVDGGTLDGVCVSNIAMNGVGCPIFVRLGNRARPYKPDAPVRGIGVLRNVTISNIEAVANDTVGCSITGMPGHPVENVSINHVRIRFPGGNDGAAVAAAVPEAAEKYPEYKMFGMLPAYGFYCRHARNISFNEVEMGFEQADARPAVVCDDVEQLDVMGLTAAASNPVPGVLWFVNVREARVTGCRATGSAKKFLRVDGPDSRGIRARGNRITTENRATNERKGVK